jgi:hypothetical protein
MFCPECQLVVGEESAACPACGGLLRDVQRADAVEAVEAMALLTAPTESAADSSRAMVQVPVRSALPALSRMAGLAGLPALAWRQPAVRAAVRTGASVLVLSLAVRAARAVIQSRRPPQAVAEGMLPLLSDLMQRRDGESRAARDGQPVAVVETFIYVRRVVRRP